MLNLFKLKKKDNIFRYKDQNGEFVGKIKNTIPANKEWYNNIYVFNKNSLKLLPVADNVITNFIKIYLNIFYNKIEKTKSRRKDIIARRKSALKIWFSRPEIKHTNSKLIINLYIYNRQYKFYQQNLSKIVHIWNKKTEFMWNTSILFNHFIKLISNIKLFYTMLLLIPSLNNNKTNKNIFIEFDQIILNYTKKILKKEIGYMRFKQTMLFNRFKFNTYIIGLKQILQKIYNKKVVFNLISLKYFYLNSSILSQILTSKIIKKNNNVVRMLTASLRNIRTPILNKTTIKRVDVKLIEAQNIIVSDFFNLDSDDNLNLCIAAKNFKSANKDLEQVVLTNTKYKIISGITLKASGRITRRIIAERARHSVKSIGTLKNVNSSYKGLSSVMMRGYKKSNIDSTFLKSTRHVGVFGLKGWVSSY